MQHFRRFLSKLAFDIAPAAIASIIGAFLFTHHYTQPPPATPVAAAPPENEQLIEMVRDEHKLLVQYFKTEQAKEQAIREQEAREKKEAAAVQRSNPQPSPLPERKASLPAEA